MTEGNDTTFEVTKLWNKSFVILFIVSFFQLMGSQMAYTLVPLYADSLGATATAVGMVTSAFAITAIAIRPFVGPAFDSFSKKRFYLLGVAIIIVSMVLYNFVHTIPSMIVIRLLHGAGMGITGPLGLAFATEYVPHDRMSSGVSIYTLGQAISQAIGPAFGIEVSRTLGFGMAFILAAAMLTTAFFLLLFVRERKDVARPPYVIKLSRIFAREAVAPAVIIAFFAVAFSCTSAYVALFGQIQGIRGVGLYFTVNALCLLAARPLFGKLADKRGIKAALFPALVLFAVSYVTLACSHTLAWFIVSAVVGACGYGVSMPLIQAYMINRVPEQFRGAGSNTTYIGLDVGMLIGPVIAGAVIEAFIPMLGDQVAAYSGMWLVMIIPIILSLVVFLVVERRDGRKKQGTEDSAA